MAATTIPPLTLYSAKVCPWAQRATLALQEVGEKYNHVEIDLKNKPSWYKEKVNPASKVPVLQLGDSDSAPKIPESHVILELVADLYKDKHPLLPTDPILRAEARYFIARFNDVVSGPYNAINYRGDTSVTPQLLEGIEEIQGILARRPGKFLLGDEISIGDLGVAPFIGRAVASGKAGLLGDAWTTITTDPKYKPFLDYADALTSRPSWKATFEEPYIIEQTKARRAAAGLA